MTFENFKDSILFFFKHYGWESKDLNIILKKTWQTSLLNFSKSTNKYHFENGNVKVDFNNLDQSVYLIYFASKFAYENKNFNMARNFYFLNRQLNSVDIFYEVDLPIHTLFIHPVGTVLGRAQYGDFLVIYQGVSVGSDLDGNYPEIVGKNILFGNSTILGKSKLGVNSCLSSGAYAYNLNIPSNYYLRNRTLMKVSNSKKPYIKNFYNID